MFDFVVFPGIEDRVTVNGEVLAEVDIIGIGAKTGTVVWLDDNITGGNGFKDFSIGKNHFLNLMGKNSFF